MSWVNRKNELKSWAEIHNRAAILMTKDGWFWGVLAANTLGLFVGKENFLKYFASTFGPLVGIPKEYSYEQARSVITHEVGGHVNQFWAFGLFIPYLGPWIGIIGMTIFYGLLLPYGFNWFRYRLELHADKQKWKYMIAKGATLQEVEARARRFAITVAKKYGRPVPEKWAVWGFVRSARKVYASRRKR